MGGHVFQSAQRTKVETNISMKPSWTGSLNPTDSGGKAELHW
jgi:hypothetical protein